MHTDIIPRAPRPLLFFSKTKSIEWLMTAFMAGWAITLIVPGSTFSMPSYRDFVALGIQQTDLATFYLILAAVRGWTLWRNGKLQLGPEIRFFCSTVGAFTWLFTGLLFFLPVLHGEPLPINASHHFVMFAGESYAIGVACFDRTFERQ